MASIDGNQNTQNNTPDRGKSEFDELFKKVTEQDQLIRTLVQEIENFKSANMALLLQTPAHGTC
jgi:hypothetical protein